VLAAFTAREVAERIRAQRQTSAYRRLLHDEEAAAEADAVYDIVLRRRPRDHEGARTTAENARRRTAEYLLRHTLSQLQALRTRMEAGRANRRVG
jgi:hypothetical protein